MVALDIDQVRSHFPALKSGFIFADNAGGSQVVKDVVDRISDYLLNTNVQLGADYSISVESTRRVLVDAPTEAAKLINAKSPNEIVFGSSSTLNLENLARSLEDEIKTGDELIVTGEHEANVGPWTKLAARQGAVIRHWRASATNPDNPYSINLNISDLIPLISPKTRIVAFTACSNILGTLMPVKEIVQAIRKEAQAQGSPKVEISVDCVAYAPHRLIDVQAWDVDYCVFSFYKVYGPHVSSLYVREKALHFSISSIAHHFLDVDKLAYKLQPGGPGYELVYATTAIVPYLLSLTPTQNLVATFDAIAEHEQTLLKPLITFLTDPVQWERGVRIVGSESIGLDRVPTVSFVVVGQKALKSKDIVKVFDERGGIGIRWGHFYAFTVIDDLSPKIDIEDGVVRISLVHYNTVEEINTIIDILLEVLSA